MGQTILVRRKKFSAAHRYYSSALTEQENREVYGACFSKHGHGHNYFLEAHFSGEVNPATGMVASLQHVDSALDALVQSLHQKHLNFDVPYFSEVNPTTENIAKFCFEQVQRGLEDSLSLAHLIKVILYESDDLWVEYVADPTDVPAPPQDESNKKMGLRL